MPEISSKPYLLRALFEWCCDNGYTPHLSVWVDNNVRIPAGYARDGMIVLNISPEACANLKMENDWIEFGARFAGVAREILIPVSNVAALFAQETGQGMSFEPVAFEVAELDNTSNNTQNESSASKDAELVGEPAPLSSQNKPQSKSQGKPNLVAVVTNQPASQPTSPPSPQSTEGESGGSPPKTRPTLTRVK